MLSLLKSKLCSVAPLILTLSRHGNATDLVEALSKLCGIPAKHLTLAEEHCHRFVKYFRDDDQIRSIQARDRIFAYEDEWRQSSNSYSDLKFLSQRTRTMFWCHY